jgi:Na+/H+ antiporter NhaD/arsenite permease-like protein
MSSRDDRLWYAGIIVIAANAGGAWSPIGDVTTTMLWIANKVSVVNLVSYLFIPSLLAMAIPSAIASFMPAFKGNIAESEEVDTETTEKYGAFMLYLGLGSIIFVPFFKTITHLPPYVGMMLSLSVVALFAEILSNRKFTMTSVSDESDKVAHHSPVHKSLTKIEMPSILFFLGILMSVAALESMGMLFNFAGWLQNATPMIGTELPTAQVSDLVVILLGGASAVIDNVPLVAASIGMFPNQLDDPLWHFIAFAAGTGGSMLIIGSAAGVVAMGMEKIDFFWYLRKFSWLAFLGYIAGAIAFIVMRLIL